MAILATLLQEDISLLYLQRCCINFSVEVLYFMFKKLLHSWLCSFPTTLSCVILAGSIQLAAAQPMAQLKGRVTNEEGTLLNGATINVGSGLWVTTTDDNGIFSASLLRGQSYRIEVSQTGYSSFLDTIHLLSEVYLEITLYPTVNYLGEVLIVNHLGNTRKQSEPVSLDLVSSSFLKSNLGGSLGHSLERLPGFTTIGIGSSQSKPLLRGLGHSRIVVTENGIKHQGQQWGSDHGLEIDQFAVGRVEIVRGPASLKYGSDAIGGLIDVRHDVAPGSNQAGGTIETSTNSGNGWLGTSAQFFTRSQSLYFRARATISAHGDFKVPADSINIYSYKVPLHRNRVRNTAGNEQHFHVSAGYIGERFSSRWFVSRYGATTGFFANAHGLEPRRVDNLLHDASTRDIQFPYHQISHFKTIGRNEWVGADSRFEISLGYQRNVRQELGSYVQHGYMPPSYQGENAELEKLFDKSIYTLHATMELYGSNGTSVQTGIHSEFQDNSIGGTSFIIPAFRQFEAGWFGIGKLPLGRSTQVQGGVRLDRTFLQTDAYFDWFSSPVYATNDTSYQQLLRATPLKRNFTSLSYAFGINHNPGLWSIRANLGKSFRIPIAKELAANGVNYHHFSYEVGDPELSPEVSYQFDAGARIEQGGVTFEATPFVNYFANYIYLNPTPRFDRLYGFGNQVFEYRQSKVLRYGSELTLDIAWRRWISTSVSADYLYSVQLTGDKKGFTLPFSPPPSMLLSMQLSPKPLANLKELYLRTDYVLAARQQNIVPPEEVTPGYGVVHLAAGGLMNLGPQQLKLAMQVKNLFNQTYFNHTSYYRLINIPEPARSLVLNVTWKF